MKLLFHWIVAASVLFDLWIIASWANVAATNCDPATAASSWNFFVIVF